MSTTRYRGGGVSLDEIRAGLEDPELTMTQRKHAFEDLRHWLAEHPDDEAAHELMRRHQEEFGRSPAAPADKPSGEGFGAISEAERRAST
jgi:hypothetical protein